MQEDETDRVIPEMSHPTSVCPDPSRWHAYDDMATELEVLDFLTALVVMLKPSRIVETGCYHGHGTVALAKGILANGAGTLATCDMGAQEVAATRDRLAAMPDLPFMSVLILQCSGIDLIGTIDYAVDLAFLDSGPDEVRCHELRALSPKLSPGGVVAIHDSGPQGFLRERYLGPMLRDLSMQHLYFDTPRGLCLCRKRPEVYP